MSDSPSPSGLAPDVASLVAQLHATGADPAAVLRQWQATRRPPSLTTALRRAALTRHFNAPLYAELCADLSDVVPFEEFVGLPEVRPLPRGTGYTICEDARASFVEDWRKEPAEWTRWNTRLATFVKEHEPRDVVSRLYYLVRVDSAQAKAFFEEEFAKTEKRFDLAGCFALLEVLTQAQKDLGTQLALSRETHHQRYNALALFAGDYYRTRTYQQRPGAQEAVEEILNSTDKWIVHLHATGGLGKTMFLRWFVTDRLLSRRVACARVDFDDVNTANVTRFPWLLLLAFAEHLDAQLPKRFFLEVIDQLAPFAASLWLAQSKAAGTPDESPSPNQSTASPEYEPGGQYIKKFGSILREVGTPIVLILDTLEGVTLSAEFVSIFGLLRELHALAPNLRVVLAGRYNITEKMMAMAGENAGATNTANATDRAAQSLTDVLAELAVSSVHFEIHRFTDDEAKTYLKSRDITDEGVIGAIIAKVREEGDGTAPVGSNPFTLSLFADLVLGRDAFSVDEVRALPSANFVYLVERVIARIQEQPLRWVVRYGALPRRLTPDFIRAVLREPLEQALRGERERDAPRVHIRGRSEIREPDLWSPEPKAKTDTLWEDLCRYEAPRGWIWRAPGTEQAVQFHGDVVDPMRDLLSSQPIFPVLQQRAIEYFEQLARDDPGRWADWICEAIFHRFQLECDQAAGYWIEQLHAARTKGVPHWPRQIAREVLRREYADDELIPRERGEPPVPITSNATLGRAHLETARAVLDENGVVATNLSDWQQFKRHVVAAQHLLAQQPAADAVVAHFSAAERSSVGDYEGAERILADAIAKADATERFGLHLHLARTQSVLRRQTVSEHYQAAIKAHPGPGLTRLSIVDLQLELAQWHVFEGNLVLAEEPFRQALTLAAGDRKAADKVRLHTGWAALRAGDFERATALANETRQGDPTSTQLRRFDAWLALAVGDLPRAAALASQALSAASGAEEEARAHDLGAKAEAERMNFAGAFTEWEEAIALFAKNDSPPPNAIESCSLDRIVVEGRITNNYSAAAASLASIQRLPGMRDAEIAARVQIEKLLVEVKSGDRAQAADTFKGLQAHRQPPWPARLRAAALSHGVALRLIEFDERTFKDLADLIRQVRPASARLELADAFRCSPGLAVSNAQRDEMLALFPTPTIGQAGFAMKALHTGEIHRVIGATASARQLLQVAFADLLERGHFLGALQAWQGLRRLDRASEIPAAGERLLAGPRDSSFGHAALVVEMTARRIETGAVADAERLLAETRASIEQNAVITRWHALHAELRAAVAAAQQQHDRSTAHAGIARNVYISLGDTEGVDRINDTFYSHNSTPVHAPAQTRRRKIVAADTGRLRELESHGYDSLAERVIASTDDSWLVQLLEQFDPGLFAAHGTEVQLELPVGPSSSLPWEWLFRPGQMHRVRHAGAPIGRETVLWIQHALNGISGRLVIDGFLGPATEKALARYAHDKGFGNIEPGAPEVLAALRDDVLRYYRERTTYRSESVPANHGAKARPIAIVKPRSMHEEAYGVSLESRAGVTTEHFYYQTNALVDIVESPDLKGFKSLVETTNPAVLHIVCALTEVNGLPALTFDRGGGRDTRSVVTAKSLSDVIRSRGYAGPFVILDVARPSSDWETARCMLLRNHFASELFAAEGVTGVLATGLGHLREVEMLTEVIAREVTSGSSQRQLVKAIHDLAVSREFPHRVTFAGAALFTSESELPCLMVEHGHTRQTQAE